MPLQSPQIVQESQPSFAVMDVGAEELLQGAEIHPYSADHARLVKKRADISGIIFARKLLKTKNL